MPVAFGGGTRNNGGISQGRHMNLTHYLFGFHGRATRSEWWLFVLIFFVYNFVVTALCVYIFGFLGLLIGWVLMIVLLWPALAISERRLHDRGKSGWWLLLFYLTPIILGSAKLWLTGEMGVRGYKDPTTVATIISFASLAITLWGLIEMGVLPGQHGDNKFGPDRRHAPTKT
jgi:uncharacterized membrane protein YhaH (DUF805 family)